MNQNYLQPSLGLEHEVPVLPHVKHSCRINQLFFAEKLVREEKLRFVNREWYAYNGKIWHPIPAVIVSKRISDDLRNIAKENNHPEMLGQITVALLASIEKMARAMAYAAGFPAIDSTLVPCRNKVLEWHGDQQRFVPVAFTPEQNLRSVLTVEYDPDASYDEFKRIVLDEVLEPADAKLLQRYLGAALLPINLTENFLLLQGVGASSKSLLARLLEEILGDGRVFDLDIKALSQSYELSGLDEQTLLVASESAGDALCSSGASFIKKMVGGDKIQTRLKYRNEKRQLCGNYSLIIVTNEQTAFRYEGSGREWKRRLLPIFFPKPHQKDIKGLVHILLEQHGPGILNWLLEGAADVLKSNWKIPLTPEQELRRDRLIARSEPVRMFVEACVELSAGDDFTSEEAYRRYCEAGRGGLLPILSMEAFCKQLSVKMAEIYPGATGSNNLRRPNGPQDKRTCRGYRGYKLKENTRI